MRGQTVLFLILLSTGAAQAIEIPAFDAQRFCAAVSAAAGGSSVIEKSCQDQESEALANIRAKSVEGLIMDYCTDVARAIGGSYVILEGCIDQEEEAKQVLP